MTALIRYREFVQDQMDATAIFTTRAEGIAYIPARLMVKAFLTLYPQYAGEEVAIRACCRDRPPYTLRSAKWTATLRRLSAARQVSHELSA